MAKLNQYNCIEYIKRALPLTENSKKLQEEFSLATLAFCVVIAVPAYAIKSSGYIAAAVICAIVNLLANIFLYILTGKSHYTVQDRLIAAFIFFFTIVADTTTLVSVIALASGGYHWDLIFLYAVPPLFPLYTMLKFSAIVYDKKKFIPPKKSKATTSVVLAMCIIFPLTWLLRRFFHPDSNTAVFIIIIITTCLNACIANGFCTLQHLYYFRKLAKMNLVDIHAKTLY